MFQLRYVASELRRRAGRTVLTALALAAGVGLVIAIVGVSQGLDEAESQVLSPVADVSTDVLVTRVAGAPPSAGTPRTTTSTSTSTTEAVDPGAATAENGGALGGLGSAGGFFGGGAAAATLNEQDAAALLSDNDTVLTDLAKLGPAGTRFVHDFFLPATLLTFPDDAIAQVAGLPDVTSAVGGLTLVAQHETGTVPNVSVTLETGEQVWAWIYTLADPGAVKLGTLIPDGDWVRYWTEQS